MGTLTMRILSLVLAAVAAAAVTVAGRAGASGADGEALNQSALVLQPIAKLGPGAGKEISGIVRSRRDPTVFWTLNDSGDEPRIYPIRADGKVIPSLREPEVPGTLIGGAINCDWEDIALDSSGRIIAADFGNNSNARADLALYFIEEPEINEGRTSFTTKVMFRYPDQKLRPAPKDDFNFDAEAIFSIGDEVYILTKHRSDTFTKLYRLNERRPDAINTLEYLDRFDIKGQATAADASPDGLRLVILTYDRIWLFTRDSLDKPFFSASANSLAYRMNDGDSDSESVCFETDHTILIADEARGTLYRVDLKLIAPDAAAAPVAEVPTR
jgi:hypothetical protein